MPDSFFDDCLTRIRMADSHRNSFITQWTGLLKEDFFKITTEAKDDRTGVIWSRLAANIEHQLPLELGEFFYQLRASLDGAIYRAVWLADKEPGDENLVEFPICAEPRYFAKHEKRIAPLPQKLRKFITAIQPYNTATTAGTPFSHINQSLKILHDCARKDRHRKLHVVGAMVTNHDFEVSIDPPGRITYTKKTASNILAGDCVIAEFGMDGHIPGSGVYTKGTYSVDIAIEEIPGRYGRSLDVTLMQCSLVAKTVIEEVQKLISI